MHGGVGNMRARADRDAPVDLVVIWEGPVDYRHRKVVENQTVGGQEAVGGIAVVPLLRSLAHRDATAGRDKCVGEAAWVSASRRRVIQQELPGSRPEHGGGSEHPRLRQRQFRGILSEQDTIDVPCGEAIAHGRDLAGEQAVRWIDEDRPKGEPFLGRRQHCLLTVRLSDLGIRDLNSPRLAAFENLLELASHAGARDDHSALHSALRQLIEHVPDQREVGDRRQVP